MAEQRGDGAPLDASVLPDASLKPDAAGGAVAYVLDDGNTLYTLDLDSLSVRKLGTPQCGDARVRDLGPFTLTTSSEQLVYIAYHDGTVYALTLPSLSCIAYVVPAQVGIGPYFGIAVAPSALGTQLYVLGTATTAQAPVLAAWGPTGPASLSPVHPVGSWDVAPRFDMQFSTSGELWALTSAGVLLEIDPTTAAVLSTENTGVPALPGGTFAVMPAGQAIYLVQGATLFRWDSTTKASQLVGTIATEGLVLAASVIP